MDGPSAGGEPALGRDPLLDDVVARAPLGRRRGRAGAVDDAPDDGAGRGAPQPGPVPAPRRHHRHRQGPRPRRLLQQVTSRSKWRCCFFLLDLRGLWFFYLLGWFTWVDWIYLFFFYLNFIGFTVMTWFC